MTGWGFAVITYLWCGSDAADEMKSMDQVSQPWSTKRWERLAMNLFGCV